MRASINDDAFRKIAFLINDSKYFKKEVINSGKIKGDKEFEQMGYRENLIMKRL